MCDVLLTQDEKRGGDNLYAAGWNAKVTNEPATKDASLVTILAFV
jgi:hypothetical protein